MTRVPRAITVAILAFSCGPSGEPDLPVRLEIPAGSSVRQIGNILAAHDIISSARRFRWYARITGQDRSLQAGVFDLTTGMTIRAALTHLVTGRTALEPLVIPEGLMLTEVAGAVRRALDLDSTRFLSAASDLELRARVGARGPTLEGYLYPTTYNVRVGADLAEVLEHMVAEFERHWKPAWNARLAELNLSRDEVVTLASIVEGEVLHDVDRPYVSSVYHNRLTRGMRLQADPTVIYALGYRRRLRERDYDIRSQYNTYQIDGLPPHPIGQPSVASIEAALFPARTDFLYFVADTDGRHVFTRTYRDHLTAIRRIRGR